MKLEQKEVYDSKSEDRCSLYYLGKANAYNDVLLMLNSKQELERSVANTPNSSNGDGNQKEDTDVEKLDLQAKEDKLKAVLNDWIISLEKSGYDIDFIESRMLSICLDHKLNLSR
jgi:hypothetical protein